MRKKGLNTYWACLILMAFLLPTSTLNPAQFFNWPYKTMTVLQPVFPWLEGLLYFLAVFALWSLTTNTHRHKTNFLKENYLGLQLAESNEACLGQENSLYMYLWSKRAICIRQVYLHWWEDKYITFHILQIHTLINPHVPVTWLPTLSFQVPLLPTAGAHLQ